MRSLWKEYLAPNGKKYYYNIEAKKTQWEKPVVMQQQPLQNKIQGYAVKDEKIVPVFVLPLLNDWNLVICNDGSKFYVSPKGDSQHKLEDSESLELLDYIDHDKLILLIAIARGYISSLADSDTVYDGLLEEIENMKKDLQGMNIDETQTTDFENENEPNKLKLEDDGTRQHDLTLLDDLNDISERDGQSQHTSEREDFKKLFDKYNLDKFSIWRTEIKKIEADPLFYSINNDQEREDIFEEWCSNINSTINEEDIQEESFESSDEDEDENDDLEPTKYHYLSHIVSKADIAKDTIFQDIKIRQKLVFKELRIKDFVKSKKEQEEFVSKLLFYYKRYNLQGRTLLFNDLLTKNKMIIMTSMKTNTQNTQQLLDKTKFQSIIEGDDSFAIETILLRLEHLVDIHGTSKVLESEPIYYIIGIKDKTTQLFNFLYNLYTN